MASWNVVSIYVNVGSENEMLHNSVGDLHEVLMKFDELLGKSKRSRAGGNVRAGKFVWLGTAPTRCPSTADCFSVRLRSTLVMYSNI